MLLMIDQSFLDWSFIDGMNALQEHSVNNQPRRIEATAAVAGVEATPRHVHSNTSTCSGRNSRLYSLQLLDYHISTCCDPLAQSQL
jgi:hypothetical protein